MSHKSKDNEFKFSGKLVFRWLIFAAAIFIGYLYFTKSSPPSILGDTTLGLNEVDAAPFVSSLVSKLPPESQTYINNFESTPVSKFITEKSAQITESLNGFPNKQIKELKKTIIKSIYDDLVKSIETN